MIQTITNDHFEITKKPEGATSGFFVVAVMSVALPSFLEVRG